MLMKSYICEFSRLSWCENSLLEFGCDVHCLYGCVSVCGNLRLVCVDISVNTLCILFLFIVLYL